MTPGLKQISSFAVVFLLALAGSAQNFRPPAVPLVTFDPYLSIWSDDDQLTGRNTKHWTKHEQSLVSLIRVDGQTFRIMGRDPSDLPPLPQVELTVTPTRTIYEFEGAGIHVSLAFMTPALPNDLDAFSLPLSFLTWQVRSVDGKNHDLELYDSTSSELVVNHTKEQVEWSRERAGRLIALRVGTVEQPVVGSSGDDHRIDWGYAYAAAPAADASAAIGGDKSLLESFVATGRLPGQDDLRMPRAVNDDQPVLAFAFNLGSVSDLAVTRQVIVAYDEIVAIKYFGQRLLPYWKRNGATAPEMLQKASAEYPKLAERCAKFDQELMADAQRVGGEKYAQMIALAYRQCAAACGLAADPHKQPLFFTKENTSNGDIATVDVFFPMDPQWLLLSPTLAKATLVPILSYAASWHWKFPNAPHDLGTYPIARGTDDGGEGMPVEESGNMLILCDAVSQITGSPKWLDPWWPKLTEWAKYLENYGLDPEEQLCTDDFMGHLAHNANLSIKAILGLAAYGDLCQQRGEHKSARKYAELAKADAAHWVQVAADGDHFRLAFDKPNTWSQKYNLVWDRILGLNVFPPSVAAMEVAHYRKVMQPYGVPLDSRTHLTKTDWSFWSASLATNQDDFEAIISPIYDYLNHTTARSPFVDSYETDDIHSDGMHARPVIGGVFIKMLTDRQLWKKWASRDHNKVGHWAPLPPERKFTIVVPTAKTTPATWRYTTQKPAATWTAAGFDASAWPEGEASFGTEGTPGAFVHTRWATDDIWLRRQLTLPDKKFHNLHFYVDHDEDVEVYVDGVLASSEPSFTTSYVPLDITPAALQFLKPGATVTVAVHCHQTTGGQNIDVGLVDFAK
ncbi:MAG TPA: DUF5127 domain-containing protein [Candidatus Acidoferrales bacterium]|nr:DUF5127 domain-containing protein [Candidatus Acidoferrales bacterium]